jgi:hypothetical protein
MPAALNYSCLGRLSCTKNERTLRENGKKYRSMPQGDALKSATATTKNEAEWYLLKPDTAVFAISKGYTGAQRRSNLHLTG